MGGRGSRSSRAAGGGGADADRDEPAAVDNIPQREAPARTGQSEQGTATTSAARQSAESAAVKQANRVESDAKTIESIRNSTRDGKVAPMTMASANMIESTAGTAARNAANQAKAAGTKVAADAAARAASSYQRIRQLNTEIRNRYRDAHGMPRIKE